ncbi:MAG: HAD family phosphatase [Cyanothece sp. SIO1E1]|nr:HAD family phosphatase [Cyanothece sp. SIO1E1]
MGNGLKAVLFDFNGVIINDEPIHKALVEQLLGQENLQLVAGEYQQVCLGRSDRACFTELLSRRGLMMQPADLQHLLLHKARAYQETLATLAKLPLYPGLEDLIFKLRAADVKMAMVTGAQRADVKLVLSRTQLATYFSSIVTADDIPTSKPAPDGYLLAVKHLNRQYQGLNLKPCNCLVIEDTFAGIEAARQAGMPVVGVANTYPFHLIQRRANWVVDYLSELDLDWVREVFAATNTHDQSAMHSVNRQGIMPIDKA